MFLEVGKGNGNTEPVTQVAGFGVFGAFVGVILN